jgi:hypothetical protein
VLLHLLFAGFLVPTIVSVSFFMLPRFTRRPFPANGLAVLPVPLFFGPALVAWGTLESADGLRVGATLEAVGLAAFAVMVLVLLARSGRRRQSFLAYGAASASLMAGLGIGVAFAFRGPAPELIPVHGALNVFGFVGLFVVGASIDLYAPALRTGLVAFRRHGLAVLALTSAGLAAAIVLQVLGGPGARVGFAVYAAGVALHLAGAVATLARAGASHGGRS